jgi:predicted methyltransferase
MKIVFFLGLISSLCLSACNSSPVKVLDNSKHIDSLQAAVASDLRSSDNRLRDGYRHPVETLEFFGLKPDMNVVEIWPSAGWYAEILAPYLSAHGKYIAAVNRSNRPEVLKGNHKFEGWVNAHPEVKVNLSEFTPPQKTAIAPDNSADMILTFRNVHNWMGNHAEAAAFQAFFKALKPGGILGVVEHRANPKGKLDPKSGYVLEKTVISLATAAGFKLVDKSEINANPADTKNYQNGVWSLPPNNRHEKQDDAKFLAIGESDRMTLKFVK